MQIQKVTDILFDKIKDENINIEFCENCLGELIYFKDSSSYTCSECCININAGAIHPENFIHLPYKQQKENLQDKYYYKKSAPYKQIVHFGEFLRQKSGGGTLVPQDKLDYIELQFQLNHTPKEKYTEELVKKYLRLLCWSKKYGECSTQIIKILTGNNSIWLNSTQEFQVKEMFLKCTELWKEMPKRIKEHRGRNFPNYEDFTKRCCITLGYNQVADRLKLLKCARGNWEMSHIWNYFCIKNNWKNVFKN